MTWFDVVDAFWLVLWIVIGVRLRRVHRAIDALEAKIRAQGGVRETFERMQGHGIRVTLRGNGPDRAYRVKMQGNTMPRVVRVHGELRNWYRLTDAKENWPVYELVHRGAD